MTDLVVIFRTPVADRGGRRPRACSRRTASPSLVASDMPRTPFPLSRQRAARSRCRPRTPTQARRIIDSHRDERTGARVVPLGAEFEPLERTHRLPLPRPRPARARADAPLARARGRQRRRHRQRVARVPRRRGARLRHRRHAVPRVPAAQRRAEVEAQGVARLGDVAGAARRAARPRRRSCSSAAARRRPAAGASRRCIADGYEALIAAIYLDGGIEPARAFIAREFADADRRGAAHRRGRGVHRGLQVGAAGVAAVATTAACRRTAWPAESGPPHRQLFEVEVLVGGRAAGAGRAGRARRKRRRRRRRAGDAANAPGSLIPSDQSISMMPQLFSRGRRRGARRRAPAPARPAAAAAEHVAVHLARDVVVGRRRRRGSAAGPRAAAADRRSCSASAATRSGRRPRATTGSPWSSPGVRCRRSAISVSVSGSSSASTSRIALSAP